MTVPHSHRPGAAPPLTLTPDDVAGDGAASAAAAGDARARAYRLHWRTNLMAIAVVLAISATASFAPPIWARALAPIRVAGMELPFYMGAQGAIVIYVLLVIAYAAVMAQADRRLRARLAGLPAHDPLHDDDPAIEDLPR